MISQLSMLMERKTASNTPKFLQRSSPIQRPLSPWFTTPLNPNGASWGCEGRGWGQRSVEMVSVLFDCICTVNLWVRIPFGDSKYSHTRSFITCYKLQTEVYCNQHRKKEKPTMKKNLYGKYFWLYTISWFAK